MQHLCGNLSIEKEQHLKREAEKEQMRMKVRKIVSKLKPDAKDYDKKLKLLSELIEEPDCGHIIDKELVNWCRRHGLKPECNFEDRTSWWTCSAR